MQSGRVHRWDRRLGITLKETEASSFDSQLETAASRAPKVQHCSCLRETAHHPLLRKLNVQEPGMGQKRGQGKVKFFPAGLEADRQLGWQSGLRLSLVLPIVWVYKYQMPARQALRVEAKVALWPQRQRRRRQKAFQGPLLTLSHEERGIQSATSAVCHRPRCTNS